MTTQEKLDMYRTINVRGGNWDDFLIEDFKRLGFCLGIDIHAIYWSGFWSQGDGACFVGSWTFDPAATRRIREEAPQTTELHEVANKLEDLQRSVYERLDVLSAVLAGVPDNEAALLTATVEARNRNYTHEHSVCIDAMMGEDCAPRDIEDDIAQCLRAFMRWMYRTLEEEYHYQTSDEAVLAALEATDEIAKRLQP